MEGIIPKETSNEDFRNYLAVDVELQKNPKKLREQVVHHWHNQQKLTHSSRHVHLLSHSHLVITIN